MWILCILLAYIHFYLLYYLSTIYLFLKRVGLVQTSMYQLVTYIMSRQCGEIKTEKGLLTTLKLMLIVNTVFYVYLNSFFVHALPIIRMVDVCTWFKGNNNIWQINSWLLTHATWHFHHKALISKPYIQQNIPYMVYLFIN